MKKFIVVVGGVLSGVGKGVISASIGKIIKEYGFATTIIKIDPYINYDAGTLRPTEHGEVWVTDDGGEIDQDLGTYERFLDQNISKKNNITTGQIYKDVIDRERQGYYLGETVQFIPHIPNEIIRRIKHAAENYDVVVIEVGGTVGDYENVPFLFALKALEHEVGSDSICYALVSYLPIPNHIAEMKTKPTQQAIKLLRQEGIFPDFLLCRGVKPLDNVRKKKIESYLHISSDCIISVPDVKTIYQIPIDLEKEFMGSKLLQRLSLQPKKLPNWFSWEEKVALLASPSQKNVTIAIVGKYLNTGDFSLTDSYISIYQALLHAGVDQKIGVNIVWIDALKYEKNIDELKELKTFNGIIIPGGFGKSGTEGKIKVIEYARVNNIPLLGLCYGLQLAVIECARNLAHKSNAHSTEVNPQTQDPVVTILPAQKTALEDNDYGGTMRLGEYKAVLTSDSHTHTIYNTYKGSSDIEKHTVFERHRHRYEVNPTYIPMLEKAGLIISGYHDRSDGTKLVEFVEYKNHPFFITTQAHPEFKSRFGSPSPLFTGFVAACKKEL